MWYRKKQLAQYNQNGFGNETGINCNNATYASRAKQTRNVYGRAPTATTIRTNTVMTGPLPKNKKTWNAERI